MGAGGRPRFCSTCGGELYPGSRFCGRCGAPQVAPREGGGRGLLVGVIVVVVVGGGAVAGILVGRSGKQPTPLLCVAGVCPRFPVGKPVRLEANHPAFGKVRLRVPARALPTETELTIAPAPPDSRPPRITDLNRDADPTVIGPVVRFGPDGQTFDAPVRLELPFAPDKVPADQTVAAMTWDGEHAERLTPISVDRETGVVVVELEHFSDVAAVIDPGPKVAFVPPPPPKPPEPPPCPPLPRTPDKCPWTPDGYTVGECTPGFCWDGGPQGFLACKQRDVPPGANRGENMNPYCATGTPVWDRCTGVLTACAR